MEDVYKTMIADLGLQYLKEVHGKYKNYKSSPLGQKAVVMARNTADIPFVSVQTLTGKPVTSSGRIYDELLAGGSKFNSVNAEYLRALVQKNDKLWVQTLKRTDTGYTLLREFKRTDQLPCYVLRSFESSLETSGNPSKYEGYVETPLTRRKKVIKNGELPPDDPGYTLMMNR